MACPFTTTELYRNKVPENVFGGILGVGAKIFCGNLPRNAMTADLRHLVKHCRDALNTLVCTSGKVITKKQNVYAMRVTFHPFAALTPLNL